MFAPDDGTRTTALLRARLGSALESVTEEWHWYQGRRSDLLRFWLHFPCVPALRLHGTGDLSSPARCVGGVLLGFDAATITGRPRSARR
ncbi:hypothetical protein [Amycolatopsis tolypomycina]|uniref:hypothetical protein n=1 Tax=Amycolatopsis tolypomycina TaxID=208445 RepID=UPI0033B0FFA4